MKLQSVLKTIANVTLTALIVVPFGHPSINAQPVDQFTDHPARIASQAYSSVFSDFDGDHRPDRAEANSSGAVHFVRIRFGNSLECELEFGSRFHSPGTLLAGDINHDNKADLVWVYHSGSEPPVVWLGDGLGHFANPAVWDNDADLPSMLFGDSEPAVVGDVNDERAYHSQDAPSSELPDDSNFEVDPLKALVIPGRDRRRDPCPFPSSLSERGPPSNRLV